MTLVLQVEFLAEMEGHFFGSEPTEQSDQENCEGELDPLVDPFADISEVEQSLGEERGAEQEDEVMILG